MNTRQAFEKTMGKPPYEFEFGRMGDHQAWPGSYSSYSVHCAWDAWQEAIEYVRKHGIPPGEESKASTAAMETWR